MTYIVVSKVQKDLEWDYRKSDRNRLERGLPFDLARVIFQGPTIERPDLRHNYGERRVQAVGMAGGMILLCVYTDRDCARRIISLRPANKGERDEYRSTFET